MCNFANEKKKKGILETKDGKKPNINKSMVVALLKIEKVVSRIDRVDMLRYI